MSNKISRRDFLKGAVASAGAIAATGVLGACASETTECPKAEVTECSTVSADVPNWLGVEPEVSDIAETWETDTVIVGAGNGGMACAAYASKLGLDFRIIQNTSVIGDTRHWYGAVNARRAKELGVNVDVARLRREVLRYSSGKTKLEVLNTWINESAAMADFVDEVYAELAPDATCTYTYGEEAYWPESARDGYYFPEIEHTWSRNVDERNKLFEQYIQARGHEIDYNYALVKLVHTEGKVSGVIAQNVDTKAYVQINAKNVVLATGGYPGNPDMMKELDPLGSSVITAVSYQPLDRGQGIKAAVWAGAKLQEEPAPMLFDRGLVAPGVDAGYDENNQFRGTVRQFNPGTQPFLKVNRLGKRFTCESGPYNDMSYAAAQQPGHVYASILDANWTEDVKKFHTIGCSAQTRNDTERMIGLMDGYITDGLVFKADTIEDLGKQLGFEGDALTNFIATVDRYNELYDMQDDPDFGKPAVRLSALRQAPFYGFWLGASLLTTEQGIEINGKGQALDADSNVIEGLYVVGDCSGGMFANNYPCLMPGIACGRTLTYGVKVAKVIAGIED